MNTPGPKSSVTVNSPLLTAVVAGLLLAGGFGLARLLSGQSLTLGPGYLVVAWVTGPGHSFWLLFAILVLRCMVTTVAVAGSGAGAVIVPAVDGGLHVVLVARGDAEAEHVDQQLIALDPHRVGQAGHGRDPRGQMFGDGNVWKGFGQDEIRCCAGGFRPRSQGCG